MIRLLWIIILLLPMTYANDAMGNVPQWAEWSADGKYLAVSDPERAGFYIFDCREQKTTFIAETLTAGSQANWSQTGNKITFKIVQQYDDIRLQAPAIYDMDKGAITLLHLPQPLVGNPVFGGDYIAFTVDTSLHIVDHNYKTIRTLALPHYINTLSFSPDGTRILYRGLNNDIYQVDWKTGNHRVMVTDAQELFAPQWGPRGKQFMVRTIEGNSILANATGKLGNFPGMIDSKWTSDSSFYSLVARGKQRENISFDLVLIDINQRSEKVLQQNILDDYCSVHPQYKWIAMAKQGQLRIIKERNSQIFSLTQRAEIISCPQLFSENVRKVRGEKTMIGSVPYIHQVYDTKLTRAVACGATSGTMILGYYRRLKDWDYVTPSPFSHAAPYGNYITEKYTWNGVVFDKWGSGSSQPAYGGHGYVWHKPVNTKEHLKEYLEHHNVSSKVDWSPSWSTLQSKINARHPMVILTSITSSGHYKTVIGYHHNQHTLIVNDPYGNKNEGYGRYNGAAVSYDWPGYNNGYANLNTVHCFIYGDATPPTVKPGTIANPIAINSFPYTNNNSTASSNGTDVFNSYNTAPKANENGREITYRFTVNRTGTLHASVECDRGVDIDIHLLSAPSAKSCIIRAHESFSQKIAPGTYYLVCDTFVSGGHELMGKYKLICKFDEK